MQLPARKVYEVLSANGVKKLYHANSVLTACQFLRAAALLSRGTVEQRGLPQTDQSSDSIDRKYSLWFDVFVDTVDIHDRATQENYYGPVLFVLDSKILLRSDISHVWVTKLNPTKWTGSKHKDRWFVSIEDLEESYIPGEFNHTIVFRHCGGMLPFEDSLKEFVVDDPRMKIGKLDVDCFSVAYGALRLAMADAGQHITITKRKCARRCKCLGHYQSDMAKVKRMFTPK